MAHAGRRAIARSTAVLAVASMLAALLAACAAPSGGTTVTQGYYGGEISVLNSPVTYGYDGVAGQDLNLFYGLSFAETQRRLELVAPGGGVVAPIEQRDGATDRFILPTTGRYSIRLLYPNADTKVQRFSLVVSRDEDRGPTDLGPLGSVFIGQEVTYHYAGTAGEQLNRYQVARVVAPDGTRLGDNGLRSAQVTLPVTGDYRIVATNSVAVLSNDLPPIAASLGRVDLPPLQRGQHVDVLYAGTVGEALGVGTTSYDLELAVGRADWTPLSPTPSSRGSRFVLPATATYRVVATGQTFGTPAASALWFSHDLELGAVGEGSFATPSRVPGQSVVLRHARPSGGAFRVRTFDPPGLKPRIFVTGPTGLTLTGVTESGPSDPWTTYSPAESGEHTVLVVPTESPGDGPITVELDDLP